MRKAQIWRKFAVAAAIAGGVAAPLAVGATQVGAASGQPQHVAVLASTSWQ